MPRLPDLYESESREVDTSAALGASRHQHAFYDYHAEHPQVYEWFNYFCREMIASGVNKFGAPVIWERIRYESLLQTGEKPYKLPNQLRPYYAREFQRLNPE